MSNSEVVKQRDSGVLILMKRQVFGKKNQKEKNRCIIFCVSRILEREYGKFLTNFFFDKKSQLNFFSQKIPILNFLK